MKSDQDPYDEVFAEPKDPLPSGVKNYVTPKGADELRRELKRVEEEIRPEVSRERDDRERTKRIAALDRRIQFLRDRVANMVIVDPKTQDPDTVRFGATVTVADPDGNERVYQIVGVDESDPGKGKISWIAPIAKGLISARVGDVVALELPQGDVELEILEIEYR